MISCPHISFSKRNSKKYIADLNKEALLAAWQF